MLLQRIKKNEEEERAGSGMEKAILCVFRECVHMHALTFLVVLIRGPVLRTLFSLHL